MYLLANGLPQAVTAFIVLLTVCFEFSDWAFCRISRFMHSFICSISRNVKYFLHPPTQLSELLKVILLKSGHFKRQNKIWIYKRTRRCRNVYERRKKQKRCVAIYHLRALRWNGEIFLLIIWHWNMKLNKS